MTNTNTNTIKNLKSATTMTRKVEIAIYLANGDAERAWELANAHSTYGLDRGIWNATMARRAK